MNFVKLICGALLLALTAFNLSAQEAAGSSKKPGDSCPAISVTGPASGVRSGDSMTFIANVTGADKIEITSYNWAVTAGSITSGQGTPVITIDTKGLEETTVVTATVSIQGNFSGQCAKQASEAGFIYLEPKARLIDKFSASAGNCEYVQANLDSFMTDLGNDPTSAGYIITYGTPRAISTAERIIRGWIKFRHFDPSRITIVRGGGNSKRADIELWLAPAGATPPEPSAQVETNEPPEPEIKPVVMKKPYIFDSDFIALDGGCVSDEQSLDLDIESYALSLKQNPKSRGNIVIYETSKKSFREKEKEILAGLKENGLDRRKIKTFFVKVKPVTIATRGEGIELWLLPKN